MFTSTMFQSIKEALAKNETSSSTALYKEILKFKAGNTYTLRLLPNIKNPSKTFFHHYVHGWTSFATGQYVSALSLQTFGERDPIAEDRYRLIRLGSEEDKKKAESVRRQEYWCVNVYVVDDPTNPENNGQVKILRYGKQLHKIIDAAINGEDSAEFGAKVFDLSKNGCNLKIKAEKQGDYTVYVASRFTSPVDLNLSDSKADEIYSKCYELEGVAPAKSNEELVSLWNTHFYAKTDAPVASQTNVVQASFAAKEEVSQPVQAKLQNNPEPVKETSDSFEIDDETVNELLKGLE